jgi:hypothetical protein
MFLILGNYKPEEKEQDIHANRSYFTEKLI